MRKTFIVSQHLFSKETKKAYHSHYRLRHNFVDDTIASSDGVVQQLKTFQFDQQPFVYVSILCRCCGAARAVFFTNICRYGSKTWVQRSF
jgi:hypothetical protein